MKFGDKVKQGIWNMIYPVFRPLMRMLLPFHKKGRQPYLLGWLAPGTTLEDLKNYLSTHWQFGNHFIAWQDEGQVLSWRRLDGFEKQYHLRVFCDGEIRGHYEYTPEAHPILHFREKGEESRKEDFVKFLDKNIVFEKHISHLECDASMKGKCAPQITYAQTLGMLRGTQ